MNGFKRKTGLVLAWVLVALALSGVDSFAQNNSKNYMPYRVERGDTVYFDDIPPSWAFPREQRKKGKDYKQYYRLVHNFNKVYPYALVARRIVEIVDSTIATDNMTRVQREKYISKMQGELFGAFEKPLRGMTYSQGKLLVKLIDREIGKSSYDIIKDYKSGIAAGFWQGVAKIFDNDLKKRYDPYGDDITVEFLVDKWEKGEFPALYYSIFWEWPVQQEIPSKYK